jgi:hypothetical protein
MKRALVEERKQDKQDLKQDKDIGGSKPGRPGKVVTR